MVPHDLGNDQVADVDWIKCAAKNRKPSNCGHALSNLPDRPASGDRNADVAV